MFTKTMKSALLLIIAVILTACSVNKLPPASLKDVNQNIENYSYVLGPDDTITIFVWRNPELGGTFPVRPDGKISTSLIEDVHVAGMTPNQAARLFEKELALYLKDPIVTVSVSGFRGPSYQQIRVVGSALQRKFFFQFWKISL